MSSGDFDADRYRRLAQTLAEALDAQPADSLWRAAKALEVSEYPPGKTLPFNVRFPPTQPLTDAYATLADL